MAVVWRAFDPELDRALAIKVLHASGDANTQRFLAEARITAQLQHPGIPPVHEIGRLDDGRPFFTMKLIQGQTLAKLLRDRPSPAHDLPRLLQVFGKICQTLAYAHSRGVIHRDLKPSNIMVGAFGEVQVMDWGLAKSRIVGVTVEPVIASAKSGPRRPADLTQLGDVLGTPAYMPPEQARGEVERLDERADVFGLGAILCEILTGRPPFPGPDVSSSLLRSGSADLDECHAALDRSGADPSLIALARKCLSATAADRPESARAVAASMEAYETSVQERLQKAELERARGEIKAAEERKRRRLTLGFAAAVVLMVAGVGVAAWWSEKKQAELERQQSEQRAERARQQERARLQTEDAIRRVRGLYPGALWKEAGELLDAAETNRRDTEEHRTRLQELRREVKLLARLDQIRLERTLLVDGNYNFQKAGDQFPEAFHEAGFDILTGQMDEQAAKVRASPVREYLLAALDDWATTPGEKHAAARLRLWELTAVITGDAWRKEVVDKDGMATKERLERIVASTPRGKIPPNLLAWIGILLDHFEGNGLALMEEAWRRKPGDFWLCYVLGNALQQPRHNRAEEAIGYYRAAMALRPDSVAVLLNLGRALREKKDFDGAVAAYRKAVEIDPSYPPAWASLGYALAEKKDLTGAAAAYRKALELDDRSGMNWSNLSLALRQRRDLDGAMKAARKAVEVDPELDRAWNSLGLVHQEKKQLKEALEAFQKARTINPSYADPWGNIGLVLRDLKDLPGAIAATSRAVELDPRNVQALLNLGGLLVSKGEKERAVEAYRKALAIEPRHVNGNAAMGAALYGVGQFAQARDYFRRFEELAPPQHSMRGMSTILREDAERMVEAETVLAALDRGEKPTLNPAALLTLGRLCRDYRQRPARGLQFYREAMAADPQLADRHIQVVRSGAARAAVLAATGAGDAAKLDEKERAKLRGEALDWLRADLYAWKRGPRDAGTLSRMKSSVGGWQTSSDFVSVRDPQALSRLPAEERAGWEKFWADIAALLADIGTK